MQQRVQSRGISWGIFALIKVYSQCHPHARWSGTPARVPAHHGVNPASEPPRHGSVCKAPDKGLQATTPCADATLAIFSPQGGLYQGIPRRCHDRRHPFMTADGPFVTGVELLIPSYPCRVPKCGSRPQDAGVDLRGCRSVGRQADSSTAMQGRGEEKEGLLRARWSQMTREQQPTAFH